jgi:hypothetical protein
VANAAMLADINVLFVPPKLDSLDPKAFIPGVSIPKAIEALGLQDSDYVRTFVEAMPTHIVDTMLGAIYSALSTDPRSTVTVAWMEASQYGVKVSEVAAATTKLRGAVTILLTAPLPE